MIHLELGEPDFATPANIVESGISAIKAGNTKYVNSSGIKELREAAQHVTMKSRNFKPNLNQILVTPGANIQIYLAIACAADPGDEIVYPDPGFASYSSIIKSLGCRPVPVKTFEENGFRLSPADVRAAISSKTAMIIINSPSNPTGAVLDEQAVTDIYKISEEFGLYILSDEIYARMIYKKENSFFSPSSIDYCKTNSIVVNGFSKSYSMTGWRLGVVTGPTQLIEKMGTLLETMLSCTPSFIQYAGLEALTGSRCEVQTMINAYRKRRNKLVSGLNEINGFSCGMPDGAFYAFPNITETGFSSEELAKLLMHEVGVVISPGNIFGQAGEGFLRFSYATSPEKIDEALNRLKTFFNH